jgi:hypothetical protein
VISRISFVDALRAYKLGKLPDYRQTVSSLVYQYRAGTLVPRHNSYSVVSALMIGKHYISRVARQVFFAEILGIYPRRALESPHKTARQRVTLILRIFIGVAGIASHCRHVMYYSKKINGYNVYKA